MPDDYTSEDLRYGRCVSLSIRPETECLLCKQTASCLIVDTSEDEYTPLTACRSCLIKWLPE